MAGGSDAYENFRYYRTSDYWIALTKNGVWKWDVGSHSHLQGNENWGWWQNGQPSGGNDQDCAHVGWDGTRVDDSRCDVGKSVLCVKRKYMRFLR